MTYELDTNESVPSTQPESGVNTRSRVPPVEQTYRFGKKLLESGLDLLPLNIETLQINITKLCNQACTHCHVDSSPRRREMMSPKVLDQLIAILAENEQIKTFDITGGAPELHPDFKSVVRRARALGKKVIVRHNLTVALDPHPMTGESMEDLHEFFAEQKVEVVSSLPYYQEYFTNKQRGDGVFQKSIESLKRLNQLGFGKEGSGLTLNLVYNPVGAFLPAGQEELEKTYKAELQSRFGIEFNQLFAITNMPIHRFKAQLRRLKTYEEYMEKLVGAFNPEAAKGVMCRSMISVDYEGYLFDCDFNQMLKMDVQIPAEKRTGERPSIFNWDTNTLLKRSIVVADHCYGCTAGSGSSCGGNTAD